MKSRLVKPAPCMPRNRSVLCISFMVSYMLSWSKLVSTRSTSYSSLCRSAKWVSQGHG